MALAQALPELDVVGAEVVPVREARPGTLFGPGKLDELRERIEREEAELVLVDGPVTPVQQRNLERAWTCKLLDRTGLILEIFSDRAATREGVLQVEMAALTYQRTRLVRAWTHLERQRGGLGFVGGPGETQIEADRRAIDEQLARLRRQLGKTVRTRELHRAARAKVPYPVMALVGYTNAGKSTLFNRLTGAEVRAEDMLFATLDPTMRAVRLPSGTDVILSDTVGFVSDLPTQLVAAFRATLEEVLSADLILHVRDISHPETEEQARDVEGILDRARRGRGSAAAGGLEQGRPARPRGGRNGEGARGAARGRVRGLGAGRAGARAAPRPGLRDPFGATARRGGAPRPCRRPPTGLALRAGRGRGRAPSGGRPPPRRALDRAPGRGVPGAGRGLGRVSLF